MKSQENQLLELLDTILDGSCTDAQQQGFTQLLDEHPELTPELVEQLRTHSLLLWQSDEPKVVPITVPVSAPVEAPPAAESTGILRMMIPQRWVWAAAAILVLVGGFAVWHPIRHRGDTQLAVAEVVDDHRVVWSDNTTALHEGGWIVPGRLEMKSGRLTLRFRSGATLYATGNVSMRIVSDMLVRLDRGQTTAHVPQWARGFTVETPNVEVVDLGTKFGVVARDGGATDVVVFEGQVDLKPTSKPATPQKRLSQGEGVRIDRQGSYDRIVEVHSDLRGEQWATQQPAWSQPAFKSISDNIPSADSPTYYQITSHGFEDDCRAYVDSPHEWNGLTSEGLPEFLRQADYVRTCNDYRYLNQLEITVELARPAMVYVFFDNRVQPPAWLTEQFEKTGIDIGLDEGPWRRGDTNHAVGVDGGQSIDRLFSVWRRRCEKVETLKLGGMGKMPGARAMYGIAATPLE